MGWWGTNLGIEEDGWLAQISKLGRAAAASYAKFHLLMSFFSGIGRLVWYITPR